MQLSINRIARGLALACVAAAGSVASGQLTHYVPFDDGYVAGFDLNGQGAFDLGFGFNVWFDGAAPGEGSSIVAGNLEYPGLDALGNHVTTPGPFNLAYYTMDPDMDANNGEPEDALQPGVHWLSFVAQTTTEADFGGLSLVKFFGPEILYIGKVGGNGGTEWGIDPGGDQQAAGGDCNLVTLIAVKLTIGPDANDDTADVYINPPVGAADPGAPDLTYGFNEDPANNRAIDEIRIGGQNGAFACDEVRIGATYADVAPGDAVCLADLNGDGLLDLDDVTMFVTGFTNMDPVADINNDGVFDLDDVTAFVGAFVAGCP